MASRNRYWPCFFIWLCEKKELKKVSLGHAGAMYRARADLANLKCIGISA